MKQPLLTKLIKTAAGKTKMMLSLVGLFVAILLLLSAVQLQSNYLELLHGKQNQDSIANFLVINKELTDANMGSSSLTDSELNDLKQQSLIESVGTLSGSRFKASIQSNSNLFPFYTDIAFETVPEEFIDISPNDWHWKEGAAFLPIIVPNQFLDFYNFQYSFSQNLPQLTPAVVKMVSFKVNLSGNGQSISMNGKVVGFSNRISSMLVPQSFMEWANAKLVQETSKQQPSRIIIKTKDPGNPALNNYLKNKGLVTDADKTRFSKYRQIVDLVVSIAGITGLIMLGFALLIFSLFIQLTIASCKEEIALLILIGYSPRHLGGFLMRRFLPAHLWIILLSLLLVSGVQYGLYHWLLNQQMILHPIISWHTIIAAILLVLLILIMNYRSIQHYLRIQQTRN